MRKVVIASPVATQSGYGHHAREVITNIIEQRGSEWDVKLVSLPWGHTPMTYPISVDLQLRIIPLPLTDQPDLWIQISVPNEFQAVGKYNIGVTAGTEGDICPAQWIETINKMQLIIVPSEFTRSTFEETAKRNNMLITTKIEVVPEYFDEAVYKSSTDTVLSELDSVTESFAFLSVGHWLQGQLGEDRKNIGAMVHCFFHTFKDVKDAPALILKTSGATYSIMDRMDIEGRINQVRDMFGTAKLPNVYLVHGDLTDAEMNSLYNHPKVKAFVSFTKAEGFGRPLLEFSATCKPIIAPHYSGQADFLKKDFICALPGQLTPIHPSAQNEFLIADAKWFSVDYGYASAMMKDVRKNYKKWAELAKRQRYFVNSTFTKTAVAEVYKQVLETVDTGLESIPKPIELKLPKLQKI
ncbi:RfaG Glycosyltransferase [uncultured Caudovirales phage]|uniref:RfaG Glycosyltransferase n=1 Tax=uncultured Caudovirales phage TaxID=2100421 RepID=A0A6J5N9U4_9CAUD|nr:RfaG Glycosyltransferase [uncultured Caudovirales phage]CAB4170481.1 RfaG Glycosyltransferase [uncultured Caudovirales phage]CAB4198597.1 RfaG Glycosyltransferase [uncultured Caudovirales phage]